MGDVNSNYEVCETYPKKLIMLKGLTNEQIVNDSDLRNNHRFPIFTWHSDDVFIFQTASIHNSYSIDNEQNLVYIYREMIPSALTFHTIVFGSDIPKLTQIASMKNSELKEPHEEFPMPVLLKNYFTDLCWFIRTFFNKQNFIDKLQQKDWFNLVKIVMRQAVSAVHEMKENYSSLIIVSKDSQDRVPLISSVIQLLADPYYRTIEGFYVLIEKEWCYFGHRFRQSLQHYNYSFKYNDSVFYSSNGTNINAHTVSIKPDDDLNSDNLENDNEDSAEPIFIIFLDCCFQIMNQFPNMFQFNTNLLLFYAKHAYSCRFGNFLTNCESERVQYEIVKNFESIQTAIQKSTNYFISLNYTPEMSGKFIIPLVEDEDFRLWKQYYLSLFNSHKIYNSKFVKV